MLKVLLVESVLEERYKTDDHPGSWNGPWPGRHFRVVLVPVGSEWMSKMEKKKVTANEEGTRTHETAQPPRRAAATRRNRDEVVIVKGGKGVLLFCSGNLGPKKARSRSVA